MVWLVVVLVLFCCALGAAITAHAVWFQGEMMRRLADRQWCSLVTVYRIQQQGNVVPFKTTAHRGWDSRGNTRDEDQ